MSGTDVASLVGTWVAAGVAIVALVGIIGPLLVWRASRSERHKALVAIGTNNNGYVSRGLTVWPGVRSLQKVYAPKLRKARLFTDKEWVSFGLPHAKPLPESPATWVQFGACLQYYGLKLDTTADITVREGKSFIPISREYMTLFLLLGRYSDKIGKQHVRDKSERLTATMLRKRTRSTHRSYGDSKLYGLTGTLTFVPQAERSCHATFTENLDQCAPIIHPETLSVASMLMFLYGFLPLPSGKHVNFRNVDMDIDTWDDSTSDGDDLILNSKPEPDRHQTSKIRVSALELIDTTGPPDGLEHLPRTGLHTISVISDVAVDRPMRAKFAEFLTMTYVPATEPWVKISGVFVRRHDTQLFALALLSMAWHPSGYVISGIAYKSTIMKMLCSVAECAPRLLYRLKRDFQALGLTSTDTPRFLAAVDTVLQNVNDTGKLLALDKVLQSLQHDARDIQYTIEILTLTNEEFRTLVYQSARYLEVSSQTQTELDPRTGTLRVPSAFGVVQVFEIDVSIFEHIPGLALSQNPTTLAHSQILLGALRAYVRSRMLSLCIDAQPVAAALDHEGVDFLMS